MITLIYSPYTQQCAAVLAALDGQEVTRLDAFSSDPVIREALEPLAVSAVPTTLFHRVDGSVFARLEGEHCTPELTQYLAEGGHVALKADRALPAAMGPFPITLSTAERTKGTPYELLLDGELVEKVTVVDGELTIYVTFPTVGEHTLSVGEFKLTFQVTEPQLAPEIDPNTLADLSADKE